MKIRDTLNTWIMFFGYGFHISTVSLPKICVLFVQEGKDGGAWERYLSSSQKFTKWYVVCRLYINLFVKYLPLASFLLLIYYINIYLQCMCTFKTKLWNHILENYGINTVWLKLPEANNFIHFFICRDVFKKKRKESL